MLVGQDKVHGLCRDLMQAGGYAAGVFPPSVAAPATGSTARPSSCGPPSEDETLDRHWLLARVLACLSLFDVLPLRCSAQMQRKLSELTVADLVADLRPRLTHAPKAPEQFRALAQVHAPPRLFAVGGYNSSWNQHEPVYQDSDASGCESSAEVVCSFQEGLDPSSRWRCTLPAMKFARADLAVTPGLLPCTIYAVGGRHGEERHDSMESLDLVRWRLTGEGWQAGPSMLEGRSGLVVGVLGNRLLACGGRSRTGVLRSAEACRLDGAGGPFEALPAMREPREYPASAVVDSKFWVLGGGETGRSSTVEIFDPEIAAWRPGPEMREGRYGGSAVWHDGRLIVVGGSHHFRKRMLTTLELCDPREGSWTRHELHAPKGSGYQSSLWGSGVAAHENRLYICGGAFREGEESLNSIYQVDLRTMQVNTLSRALGKCGQLAQARWCGGACLL